MNFLILLIRDSNSRYLRPLQFLILGLPNKSEHAGLVAFNVVWVHCGWRMAFTMGTVCLPPFPWSPRGRRAVRAESWTQVAWVKARSCREADTAVHMHTGCPVCPRETSWMNEHPFPLSSYSIPSPNACLCWDFLRAFAWTRGPKKWWLPFLYSFWEHGLVKSKKRGESWKKMWYLA